MWLIFLLIWNFILFSLFSISSCALPIDNNSNNKNNKDANLNLNGNLNKHKDQVLPSKGNEGSGVPANEITTSDDEDFFTEFKGSDHSGDGPSELHVNKDKTEDIVFTNPDHSQSVTPNRNPDSNIPDEDDEDDTEDDEDDDEDAEGSGDSSHSAGGFNIPKETIIDDDNYDKMPTGNKPDTTDILTDSSEDTKDIIIDGSGKPTDNFSPGIPVETSTKQTKPNVDDTDHDEDQEDNDDLDDSHDNEDDDHDQDENTLRNDISILGRKQDTRPVSLFAQPTMLAAVIGGIVVSLLCAILLAMFIIYRTRKKDEGSYICEPSLTSPVISHYGKGSSNKFYDP
ncbi:syndecan-like [Panonychus citri]|uniref:syndecan-like n=1 Tax=Panonychus citri TaxID=50023 RepID=UPI0023079EF5|nr:syndecan-like [Panonychus citri]XP_053210754.1 syndecan-like [Panonychus citri]